MNILLVANHYPVCSARYMADAFTRLGHSVKHVGPAHGTRVWGLSLPERYAWEPDDPTDTLFGTWADLILTMDSDPAILDMVEPFAGLGPCMAVYGVDSHVRTYTRPYFDAYFLGHKDVSLQPYDDTTFYLPCAFDPAVFAPSRVPWDARPYDVAMLGVMYPARRQAVAELQAAGLKVLWGTGLVYASCAAAYQHARISLCLSSNGDVGQRVYETAACGCVVMTDACADFRHLTPDGLWTIEPDRPLAEQARAILADPVTALTHVARSLYWVAAETWDARAKVILNWFDNDGRAS